MSASRAKAATVALFGLALSAPSRAEHGPPGAANETAAPELWIATFTQASLGLEGAGFYNQLAGARLDYRPEPRIALGLGASYVNLKGAEGRVSNVLTFSALEWRAPLGRQTTLPVRFATGYLPKNGPWLHAALGLGQPLGDSAMLTFELLAPTLWVIRDQTSWSLDVAVELALEL